MPATHHRNLRVPDDPWEPAGTRAGAVFQAPRSAVVRALLLAFAAGEADHLVSKYLAAASAEGGRPGGHTPQEPSAPSG